MPTLATRWLTPDGGSADSSELVASALGDAHNRQEPLRRFLEDGRVRMDIKRSERARRTIAAARESWLSFGSDDHANAAANLFSLIASCKLHRIDPEATFAEVIHVMPYCPRERDLELAPTCWRQTRARLDAGELASDVGHLTVSPPPSAAERVPRSQ